ncbi:MAG: gamma-glutamyltransferase family protein [Gaiellales bacterium]
MTRAARSVLALVAALAVAAATQAPGNARTDDKPTVDVAIGTGSAVSGKDTDVSLAADKPPVDVAVGTGGAVASEDPDASSAGIHILRRGGNAVDAAVAIAAVLGVTEPFAEGLGGMAYMTIYLEREKRVVVIGSRAPAPLAFGPEERRILTFSGARAVGVPTTPMVWSEALGRYGTVSLRELLQPAIRVARDGFVVDGNFNWQASSRRLRAWTSTRSLFLGPQLEPPPMGSMFSNPDLAETYQQLAKEGLRDFYDGELAQAIVNTIKQPPAAPDGANYVGELALSPGYLELSDLARHRQEVESPAHVRYRGHDVYSSPPPSSGGSTVGETLNILAGFDLSGPDRALALHRYLEASKLAYADRARWVGDPRFVDVPLGGLLSKGFADERRCLIGDSAIEAPVAPGDPAPPYATTCSTSGPGTQEQPDVGSTQHFSVADRWGNVVSYTGTLVAYGGSGIVVPGRGFFLNHDMVNFSGSPLFEGDPNVAEGGKRPRGNMAPTIVVRDGRPVLSIGAAGGQTIQTTVAGTIVNQLDFGMALPEALTVGRASQRNTPTTLAENVFLEAHGDELSARFGHPFAATSKIAIAGGISILPDGRFVAVADREGADAQVVKPDEEVVGHAE